MTTQLFNRKQTLALFWPVLLEQIMTMLMNVVSTVMIASVSDAAVAGVGMVGSVTLSITNTFLAVSTGITVVVTQYIGAKRHGDAARAASQSIVLILYLSAVIGVLMILFDRSILQFLYGNADADVLAVMREYMFYSSLSLPLVALYMTVSGIMRASGNTRLPMFGAVFANASHLLVAYPLIYVFHLGIAGVGWGLIAFRLVPALFLG
ncbi:MAG: MATE family efflux transporter, partial [Clostridia bacterium]|nr:MATE family efflux transporter [Clostridia bacterium]